MRTPAGSLEDKISRSDRKGWTYLSASIFIALMIVLNICAAFSDVFGDTGLVSKYDQLVVHLSPYLYAPLMFILSKTARSHFKDAKSYRQQLEEAKHVEVVAHN